MAKPSEVSQDQVSIIEGEPTLKTDIEASQNSQKQKIIDGVSVKYLKAEYSKVSFLGLRAQQAAWVSTGLSIYTLITIIWTSIHLTFLKLDLFSDM